MKNRLISASIAAFALSAAAFAGDKTYQVTGNVTEVNGDHIVVQKGKEEFDIARDTGTKGAEELKVGDKATVKYKMTATNVDAKPAKKASAKSK